MRRVIPMRRRGHRRRHEGDIEADDIQHQTRALPSPSCSRKPNALGNQKVYPANAPNSTPPMMTLWKVEPRERGWFVEHEVRWGNGEQNAGHCRRSRTMTMNHSKRNHKYRRGIDRTRPPYIVKPANEKPLRPGARQYHIDAMRKCALTFGASTHG